MSLESAQTIISQDIEEIIAAVGEDNFKHLAWKTLLITGPQGLLGGYIVDTIARLNETILPKSPFSVIGLSRSPIRKESRLGHLLNKPNMWLIKHNAIFPPDIECLPHYIVHAAGRSAPADFTDDPIGTIDINVTALRWLLDLAVKAKIKSFIWMSSAEIYGNPPPGWVPTPETYKGNSDPLGPRSCYTESKRCGEAMCLAFHYKYNVPIKILRPALVYGPGFPIDDKKVLSDLINSGIKGQPIQLKDEGSAQRVYLYIKDAMIIFWKVLLSDKNGEVFNLGGLLSEETTIRNIAILVHKICGIKEWPKLGSSPSLAGSPNRVCLDMIKTIDTFGYTPTTPLTEGLKKTINWAKERLI